MSQTAFAGAMISFFLAMFIFWMAVVVIMIIANWKIYQKAGYEGWEAIIPFYNIYVLLKIVGKPGWWLAMYFIPFVNVIFAIWTMNMLSKSFGKDEGFTVGMLFLPFIFRPILAFSRAEYIGPYGDPQQFQQYQNRMRFDIESGDNWRR